MAGGSVFFRRILDRSFSGDLAHLGGAWSKFSHDIFPCFSMLGRFEGVFHLLHIVVVHLFDGNVKKMTGGRGRYPLERWQRNTLPAENTGQTGKY